MTYPTDNESLVVGSSVGKTNAEGSAGTGFHDPTGSYPRESYYGSSNLNQAAVSNKTRAELYTGGGANNVAVDIGDAVPSQYPLTQVSESVSGHVIEINDTPGGERVLIKHKSGSGIELRPDGSVVISSSKNTITVCGADQSVIVDGEATLIYKGNLNLQVAGDLNIDVGGNFNVKTAGSRNTDITGNDTTTTHGNSNEIVSGASSKTVVGLSNEVRLGGHVSSVKGSYSNQVEGTATYVSSGASTITSESQMNISADDANIAASNLSVFGASGTIGGEGVVAYVKNIYGTSGTFTAGVKAPTFEGKLKGKADDACKADYATTAGAAPLGAAGAPGTQSHTAVNTTSTALPNGSNIQSYLTKSANGMRRVQIDPGDFIKNQVVKTQAYAGLSSTPLTSTQVRSTLRDPANASNSQFVGQTISEGTLSGTYNTPVPAGIGRVVNGAPSATYGQTPVGQASSQSRVSEAVIPRRGAVNIIPDPLYNPDFVSSITTKTKLAPGITMAKFTGASGDPVSLDHITDANELHSIARYYYLHAELMRSIQTNQGEFSKFRLGVHEALYVPGPTEKVTSNSINDYKMQGRAVVYELFNPNGQLDNFNTFNLAVYWKNTVNFEKLILSYDTIEGILKAYVIVVMPEIGNDWSAKCSYIVETHYNNKVLASGELIECLPIPSGPNAASFGGYPPPDGVYDGSNGKLDPTTLTPIGGGHILRGDAAEAYLNMQLAASREGITWSVTDSYRDYATQVRLAQEKGLYSQGGLAATPGTSNHGLGLAVDLGSGANEFGTPQNDWLQANAGRFGFKTIPREPWHWEFAAGSV